MAAFFATKRILRLECRRFIFIEVVEAVEVERLLIRVLTVLAAMATCSYILVIRLGML